MLLASYILDHLTSMTGGNTGGTGSTPQGLVMAPNGDLYGTTAVGGPKGYGTVFKISGTAQTLTQIAYFTGANGTTPRGGLVVDSGGNLWGTATGGGTSGRGVIWQIAAADLTATANNTSTTSVITVVSTFAGSNGSYPTSGLYADASGNFYGYTQGVNDSPNKNKSVVFKLVPAAGTNSVLTTVATFPVRDGKFITASGGLTIDSGGNIYGVTRNGGNKQNGSVFRIDATGSTFNTLVSFNGNNGSTPNGNLIVDGSGTIYGTTMFGGSNGSGTIFKITPSGTSNTLTMLKSFNGTNGNRPIGNLIMDGGGNIYGVTITGGANGPGTLFKWSQVGTTSTITTLFSFKGQKTGTNPSGPLVMDSNGHFFGTTSTGGTKNIGAVFDLAPP